MLQTRDGGFLLGGYSRSGIRGNKTVANIYGENFWLVKLAADSLTARPRLTWERCCSKLPSSYRLLLRGTPGLTYRVEFSTNLTEWSHLTEVQATDSDDEVFRADLRSEPRGFHRAILDPPR